MQKLSVISLLLLVFCASPTHAQIIDNDTLAQIVKKVFYEKKVYEKIFIKHQEYIDEPSVLLMPNMPLCRHYTEEIILRDKFEMHNRVGKKDHSSVYQNTNEGKIILTLGYYGDEYELFTAIYSFSFNSEEADIVFHTGSKYMIDSLADRYVKVTSSLVMKKGEWEIKKLKIEKTDCCKEYPYDALEIIDERHYYNIPSGQRWKPGGKY